MSEVPDRIQEAKDNAHAIAAYWNELISCGMPEDVAAQVVSNRLVVTTAINQVEDDIQYLRNVINDRDERFMGQLGLISSELDKLITDITD